MAHTSGSDVHVTTHLLPLDAKCMQNGGQRWEGERELPSAGIQPKKERVSLERERCLIDDGCDQYWEQQILVLFLSGGGVNGVRNCQSRSVSARSQWNQIVLGESEPITAVPSSPFIASRTVNESSPCPLMHLRHEFQQWSPWFLAKSSRASELAFLLLPSQPGFLAKPALSSLSPSLYRTSGCRTQDNSYDIWQRR